MLGSSSYLLGNCADGDKLAGGTW